MPDIRVDSESLAFDLSVKLKCDKNEIGRPQITVPSESVGTPTKIILFRTYKLEVHWILEPNNPIGIFGKEHG